MRRRLIALAALALIAGLSAAPAAARNGEPSAPPADADAGQRTALVDAVIGAAESYLGLPYRLGREGPDIFDCSGLVFRVFADAGQLSRVGGARLRAAGYMRWFDAHERFTTDVSLAERGDLLIYGAGKHIGLYVGDGMVISAVVSGVTLHRLDALTQDATGVLKVDWTGEGRNPQPFAGATDLPTVAEEAPAELIPALDWLPPRPTTAPDAGRTGTERVDMRTASSRTFDNGDGTFTTEIFSGSIHYQPTLGGDWQPIDLRLAPPPDGSAGAVADSAPVELVLGGADSAAGFLRVASGELSLSLHVPAAARPRDRAAAAPVIGGDGRYADFSNLLRGGAGMRLFPRADGFKAFIVLAARPRSNQISLLVDAPDVTLAAALEGGLALLDGFGQVVGRLPAPLVLDSSDVDGGGGGIARAPAALGVSAAGERTRLTMTLDDAFLADAVYPVYIDLSLVDFPDSARAGRQAMAVSRYPTLSFSGYQRPEAPAYEELWHGRLPNLPDYAEAYLRFGQLAATLGGVHVEAAELRFHPYWQHRLEQPRPTWVAAIASDWQRATLSWASRPARGATLGELRTLAGTWSGVDLTSYVQAVQAGGIVDNGFVLHASQTGPANWKRIVGGSTGDATSLAPRLVVTWSRLRPAAERTRELAAFGESLTRPAELRWTQPGLAPAASKFEVQVSADGFATIAAGSGPVGGTAGSETTWRVPDGALADGREYAWRVRVKYGRGTRWSEWSVPADFVYRTTAGGTTTSLD